MSSGFHFGTLSVDFNCQYKGIVDCGIKTIRTEGVQGLYKGMTVTLLRDIPRYFVNQAVYFVSALRGTS